MDLQGGNSLPYYHAVEIRRRGGLQYLPQGWIVLNQIVIESIIWYWVFLNVIHENVP